MFQPRFIRNSFTVAARHRFPPRVGSAFSSSCAAAAAVEEEDTAVFDSFHVLGLPRQFKVSKAELKQKYLGLMAKYHPDKNTNKTPSERDIIEKKASSITHAFQTIAHPHTRATHLLSLLGNPMEETSSSDLVGTDFLMTVMEVRENIDSTAPEYMEPLWKETKLSVEQLLEELEHSFDEESDLEKATELAARLQYWQRIETSIREKMQIE